MSNLAIQDKRGRGKNNNSYWEELRHLKIEGAEPVLIFSKENRCKACYFS